MKVAFITPPELLDLSLEGDIILTLAQFIGDNEYTRKLKKSGKTIYLDNGAHEGAYEGIDWYIEKIKILEPDLVFAPDVIYDGPATYKETTRFIEKLYEVYDGKNWKFEIAGIPQADNINGYRLFFDKLHKNEDIDWLGISYLAAAKCYPKEKISIARRNVLTKIFCSTDYTKNIHLLGFGDSFEDVKFAKSIDNVKSVDTSSPFMYGYLGFTYENNPLTAKVQTTDPSITEIDQDQRDKIIKNFNYFKNQL